MPTVYVVTCEDGQQRHPEPFDTDDEACAFAEVGCLCDGANHLITSTSAR